MIMIDDTYQHDIHQENGGIITIFIVHWVGLSNNF